MLALRLNENKVTSRKTDNIFAVESEKESKIEKRTNF